MDEQLWYCSVIRKALTTETICHWSITRTHSIIDKMEVHSTVLPFLLVLYSAVIAVRGNLPTDVTEATVVVKNMLASKCFAYPVQIFAFPDETTTDGVISAAFENCDGELPLGSEVTDIPYGIMEEGRVLSMPAQCGRKHGKEELRTGAFRVTVTNQDDDSQEIVAIVNPDSELKPAGPPTYTINSDENVDLEVDYPFPDEISWAWDGRVIQKWKRQLKINVDQGGIYQAFSRKLGRDCRVTYRVIKRACPAGLYGPPDCTGDCAGCLGACDDQDGTCICGPGISGGSCNTAHEDQGFGTQNDLYCEENGVSNPGCKGILFCRRDPYGCSCMHNYGGIDCTRRCDNPTEFGFNCEKSLG